MARPFDRLDPDTGPAQPGADPSPRGGPAVVGVGGASRCAMSDERSDEVSCTGSGPSDEVTVHESRVTIVQKGIETRVDFGRASVDQTNGTSLVRNAMPSKDLRL